MRVDTPLFSMFIIKMILGDESKFIEDIKNYVPFQVRPALTRMSEYMVVTCNERVARIDHFEWKGK
jgi:hypothetical protein